MIEPDHRIALHPADYDGVLDQNFQLLAGIQTRARPVVKVIEEIDDALAGQADGRTIAKIAINATPSLSPD
jgi:hypothetical protein